MNIRPATQKTSAKIYPIVLLLLISIYALWLLTFWPGVLGEDSLAILLEIETNRTFQSGKPDFWYFFVKTFYEPMKLVEGPIIVQMVLAACIFSRILGWCWQQGLRKVFFFLLVFICLAPHTIYFIGMLYADGIYAVATAGLLFELWLIAKTRKITRLQAAALVAIVPFAIFARSNGIILLAPILIVAYMLGTRDRIKLIGITAAWCCLVFFSGGGDQVKKHETLFPLALFETANFLQPRPMKLWVPEPLVSEKTIQIITKNHPLQVTIDHFDRDYWDPLVYRPGGPDFLALSSDDKKELVREFFRYNLWKNIPAFMGSRVNVFLVSCLAKGGFPGVDYSANILSRIKSNSVYRFFHLSSSETLLKSILDFSFNNRWLIWTPFLGIFLLFRLTHLAWKKREVAILAVTVPMVIQLGGIFTFSIAGEYRYLLPFFILPMVLLPILASSKTNAETQA